MRASGGERALEKGRIDNGVSESTWVGVGVNRSMWLWWVHKTYSHYTELMHIITSLATCLVQKDSLLWPPPPPPTLDYG